MILISVFLLNWFPSGDHLVFIALVCKGELNSGIFCYWQFLIQEGGKRKSWFFFFSNSYIESYTLSTAIPQYSCASELIKPCTCCILTRKKMFQHPVLAGDLSHLLELTWVTMPPCNRKCFITCHLKNSFGTHRFRHSSRFWNEWTSTEIPLYLIFLVSSEYITYLE